MGVGPNSGCGAAAARQSKQQKLESKARASLAARSPPYTIRTSRRRRLYRYFARIDVAVTLNDQRDRRPQTPGKFSRYPGFVPSAD